MSAQHHGFARRLERALDHAGFVRGRSRTAALADAYAVSRETARKWLRGLAFPELERMVKMAVDCHVSLDWLATGRGDPRVDAGLSAPDGQPAYVDQELLMLCTLIGKQSPKKKRAVLDLLS